jgi:hypothetical protein
VVWSMHKIDDRLNVSKILVEKSEGKKPLFRQAKVGG